MEKQNKRIMVLGMITVFVTAALFLPGLVSSGDLEPSAAPGSTMHTLGEIYELVSTRLGGLTKTGQTTSYRTGDDGDEEAGVSWLTPPRFTDNSDGTVTDNLTGLTWTKQAHYNHTAGGIVPATWNEAVDFCKALATGMCGLSDGSSAGDWRLPNVKELQSLIHYGFSTPALPNTNGTGQCTTGDPFTTVLGDYWSSTTCAGNTLCAWTVNIYDGNVDYDGKSGNSHYVWPVRGGN